MYFVSMPPKHTEATFSAREAAILDAALSLCSQYGLKKVSMDDIAQASEMSRPSLYNYFPNKKAIVQGASARLYEKALKGVEEALEVVTEPSEQLHVALLAWGADFVELLYESPHGVELLGASGELARELARDGRERCLGLLADYLSRAQEEGKLNLTRAGLDASDAAKLLLFSFQGLQSGLTTKDSYYDHLPKLLNLFLAALMEDPQC